MSYQLYGSWTIEETGMIGKKFKATCVGDRGYDLTAGLDYTIEVSPRILPMSPLCKFTDNSGKACEGHMERFEKVEEIL